MTRAVRVHLKTWVLDDGEVRPFRVGDQVEWGLGIDLEQLPVLAEQAEEDGIVALPAFEERHRARARADIIGPAQIVIDESGIPLAAIVTPAPNIALAVTGPGAIDPEWNDRRVVVRGDVVVEPYLWVAGGILRTSARQGPRAATVMRIEALFDADRTDVGGRTVDVAAATPHRSEIVDYIVGLSFA